MLVPLLSLAKHAGEASQVTKSSIPRSSPPATLEPQAARETPS